MCFQHVASSRLFFYFNIFFSCIRSTLSSVRTDEICTDELIRHGLNQIIIRSTNKDSWFRTFLVDLMTDWHEMITIYRFSFSSSSILIQEEMKIIQNWLWLYLSVPVRLGFTIPEKYQLRADWPIRTEGNAVDNIEWNVTKKMFGITSRQRHSLFTRISMDK